MAKRVKRRKKPKQRSTNWWLIFGVVGVGVIILFGLLALSFQSPSLVSLADYCQNDDANCIFKGDEDAPVTIVEISDFGCTHCRDFHEQTWPQLEMRYVETGQVRWIILPFALRSDTLSAASAALCAAEQGSFFDFQDELFAQFGNPERLTQPGLINTAASIGLDNDLFSQCLAANRYSNSVRANVNVANQQRVNSTPTFIINEQKVEGAQPFVFFQQRIELLLNS